MQLMGVEELGEVGRGFGFVLRFSRGRGDGWDIREGRERAKGAKG